MKSVEIHLFTICKNIVHSNFPNITHVATKAHEILMYVVLAWMHDNRELVQHVTLYNDTKLIF